MEKNNYIKPEIYDLTPRESLIAAACSDGGGGIQGVGECTCGDGQMGEGAPVNPAYCGGPPP